MRCSVLDDVTDLELVAGRICVDRWSKSYARRRPDAPVRSERTSRSPREQQTSQFGFNARWIQRRGRRWHASPCEAAQAARSRCGSSGLPPRWFVKSVRLDGVDVTDTAFALSLDGRRRLEIMLSDRVGRLSGMVTDREARAVSNALIVVFPEDRARWNDAPPIGSDQRYPYNLLAAARPLRDRRRFRSPPIASSRSHRCRETRGPIRKSLARLWPFTTSVTLDELRESTLHLKVVPPPTDLLQ